MPQWQGNSQCILLVLMDNVRISEPENSQRSEMLSLAGPPQNMGDFPEDSQGSLLYRRIKQFWEALTQVFDVDVLKCSLTEVLTLFFSNNIESLDV